MVFEFLSANALILFVLGTCQNTPMCSILLSLSLWKHESNSLLWGKLLQVLEMPPGAELLASSERTGIEMYSVGEHALAIQGHPEFFDDVVLDLLNNRLSEMMKEDDIKEAKASLSAARADQNVWQKLCKDFLKGQQRSQS
jgi:hypothetical protein